MSTTKLKSTTRALAFAGALSLLASFTASAAIVADGTPYPGVALAGTANYGGTAIFDVTTAFAENGVPPPAAFTGNLRTVVVRNGGGLLDFYYQISDIVVPPGGVFPTADIFAFSVDGFDPFATGVMDYSTNGLAGIAGAGAFALGNKAPLTANRDPGIDGGLGVGFAFGDPTTATNLEVGDTSFFMIVRTNATDYHAVGSNVSGLGGGAVVQTAGPTSVSAIPEPGSALIGMAVMGLCGSGLFRRNRKSVTA